MKKFRFVSRALAIVFAIIFVISIATSINVLAEQKTPDGNNTIEWVNSIDSMLEGREYVEGEVIAIVDNSIRKQLTSVEKTEEVEKLADASQASVETTFEIDLDVKKGKSEKAVSVHIISSDTKSTRELLYELADDKSVIYAEPNYLSSTEDIEESLITSNEVNLLQTENIQQLSGDGSEYKKVVFTGASEDLIETQGYSQVGDLSYLQWSYGTRTDDLYTINSPNWNTTGSTNVNGTKTTNGVAKAGSQPVVAVIDSGIDYTHPDFEGIIEDMTKYSSLGGKYGFNCSGRGEEDDPMDDNGHGTHCAGIIAAKWDALGTSGVASGVHLCVVRTSDNGLFTNAAIVRAFSYLSDAVDNGLNLLSINCSFGGEGSNNSALLMINELGEKGVITCVASGNSKSNTDEQPYSSSDYTMSPYAIGVDASNANYLPSDYTNYGQTTTDLFSPGDAILAPVSTQAKTYVPSVDKNRTFFESFNGETNDVKISFIGIKNINDTPYLTFDDEEEFQKFVDEAELVGAVDNSESFDKDNYSYKVDVPALSDADERAVYLLSMPATLDGDGNISDSTHFATALKSTLGKAQTWFRPLSCGTDDEIEGEITSDVGWQRPSNVWTNMTVSSQISTYEGEYLPTPYYQGRLYFLILVKDSGETNTESQLYVDCVGSGYSTLRYAFYQGTSMATPGVTGATAVIYDKLSTAGKLDGLTPAQKARYVANTMKASVVEKDSYSMLCTSEGAFDFSVLEKDYSPVMNTVSQEGDTLTIEGQYLGSEKGSATISGEECMVISWSDKKIVLSIPSTVQNGRHSFVLNKSNGKSATRKISLEGIKDSERDVFENQVTLPKQLENCLFSSMIGMDGIIYVVPETVNEETDDNAAILQEELWSYNAKTDTWKQYENIPLEKEAYKAGKEQSTTITSYEGLIVAHTSFVSKPSQIGVPGEYLDEILFMDPQKGTWTKADISDISLPMHGTIFATDKGLFYCGGYTLVMEEDEEEGPQLRRNPSYSIYKLEFDLKEAKAGAPVKITSAKDAGEVGSIYEGVSKSGYNNDMVALINYKVELLKWDDETQKFSSKKIVYFQENGVIGSQDEPVCFFAAYGTAVTPKGLLITAFNGDEYTKRGYDSFWFKEDETQTPFEKNAAFGDLYKPIATYTDGYVFVWGDSYFNDEEVHGYLAYTILEEDKPDVPKTGDNSEYIWMMFIVAAIALAGAIFAYRKRRSN